MSGMRNLRNVMAREKDFQPRGTEKLGDPHHILLSVLLLIGKDDGAWHRPLGSSIQAIVSVMAVKIQFISPMGVFLSCE